MPQGQLKEFEISDHRHCKLLSLQVAAIAAYFAKFLFAIRVTCKKRSCRIKKSQHFQEIMPPRWVLEWSIC